MTRPIIYELLEEIQRNLKILERLRSLSEDEFVGDAEKYLLAERCFQLSIQCVLDISSYIASQKGWQRPENSSQAVELMGRQGVLTPDFAARIAGSSADPISYAALHLHSIHAQEFKNTPRMHVDATHEVKTLIPPKLPAVA